MRKGTTLSLFAASHPKDLAPTIPVVRKENSGINEFKKKICKATPEMVLVLETATAHHLGVLPPPSTSL